MMAFFDKKHGLITATVILLIFSLIVASAFLYFKKEKALPMKYEEYVYENAEAYHVPPEIIFAVIYAESSFRPQVVSKHGAMGLMQLMPATYEELAQKLALDEEASPFSPDINIKCGTYYLHELYVMFGRWDLVITAYNAGLGRVHAWLASEEYADGEGGLAVIPFSETATYLKRVQNAVPIYRRMIETQKESLSSQ